MPRPDPDERIRVLWLAKGLGQGGMERLLVTHAQFRDRDRFDYRAAYLVDRPYSVVEELRELGVPVTRLGRGKGIGAGLLWIPDLVRLVRRERIDVVHAHSPMPAALARPALRLFAPRTRIVYTEHNRWSRFSRLTRWINRLTFRMNHTSFAVSDDCRSSMSPSARRLTQTLIHGIDVDAVAAHRANRADTRAELGLEEGTVAVGTVANLRPQKNYPLLLEVAAQVTAANPNVVFISVGQGPLEAELNALHAELDLGNRFRFLGFRSDVHSVMSAFDIFCMSSDHEGLPVALMEAMALGLPVVATDVGGIKKAVGADARLVPPGQLGALTQAVTHSVRALGEAGSETSAPRVEFSAETFVAVLESTYRPSLRGTAGPVQTRHPAG